MKTREEIIALERTIRAGIANAKANGYRLIAGAFGWPSDKSCCPLSACHLEPHESELSWNIGYAREKLGLSSDEMWSFISGFDRSPQVNVMIKNIDYAMQDLGRRIRVDLLP